MALVDHWGRRLETARYSSRSHELVLEQTQGTGGDCEGIRRFKCAGDQPAKLRVELNEIEQDKECESQALAPGDASFGLLRAGRELALALGGYQAGVGA